MSLHKNMLIVLIPLFLSLGLSLPVLAIRLEPTGGTTDSTFGVNRFLSLEYTYMGKVPMVMVDLRGDQTQSERCRALHLSGFNILI